MARGRRKKNLRNEGPPAMNPIAINLKEKKHAKKLKKAFKTSTIPVVDASASIPTLALAPIPPSTFAPTRAPVVPHIGNDNSTTTQRNEKENDNRERYAGFIFMCNGKTKPECYKYRVFGLPVGKMSDVEKIKTGAKLFLFDTDLKLLYGTYKASCDGKLSLEPAAFRGSFPAQVRFQIVKDCLPVPENAFKRAIQENYQGRSKFRPELTNRQVKALNLLFRPITAPPTQDAPQAPKMAPSRAIPHPVMEDQFRQPPRLPPPEDPYAAGLHLGHAPPGPEPRYVPPRLPPPEDPYAPRGHLGRALPVLESCRVPPTGAPTPKDWYGSSHLMRNPLALDPRHVQPVDLPPHGEPYYSAEAHRTYLRENPVAPDPYGRLPAQDPYGRLPAQDPYARLPPQDPYARYRTAPEMVTRDHLLQYEGEYHRPLMEREREIVSHPRSEVDYYGHHLARAASHAPAPAPFHAPVEMPSSSSQAAAAYWAHVAYEDRNRAYADPLQGSVLGSSGVAGTNVPVSSLYSFAGATPAYH